MPQSSIGVVFVDRLNPPGKTGHRLGDQAFLFGC
jgi:hypothetical protein